jgi:hypothetical protein
MRKVHFSQRHGIQMVTAEWFIECAHEGRKLQEVHFRPLGDVELLPAAAAVGGTQGMGTQALGQTQLGGATQVGGARLVMCLLHTIVSSYLVLLVLTIAGTCIDKLSMSTWARKRLGRHSSVARHR